MLDDCLFCLRHAQGGPEAEEPALSVVEWGGVETVYVKP